MTTQPPAKSNGRPGFLETVRVEELAQRWVWTWRDWLTVLMVPAILCLDFLPLQKLPGAYTPGYVDVGLRVVFFTVLVVLNGPLLARHWRAFRGAFWRSAGLVVAGLFIIQFLIQFTRPLLEQIGGGGADAGAGAAGLDAGPALLAIAGAEDGGAANPLEAPFLGALFLSLGPTVTALIEDFTFRHTLLVKLPVWRNFAIAAVAVVFNAFLFGAAHINNYDGNLLLTLSYAVAGLFMNLVYLWTRNIWHVLLMHGLNNFILLGPVTMIFGKLMTQFTGA